MPLPTYHRQAPPPPPPSPRYSTASRSNRVEALPDDSDSSSSLPLNTPWSTPPTSTSDSFVSRRSRRRSSASDNKRPTILRRRVSPPPPPLVVQKQLRALSPERYERPRSARAVVIPASSLSSSSSSSRRARSPSKFAGYPAARNYHNTSSSSTAYHNASTAYSKPPAPPAPPTPPARDGKTRFTSENLVSREALLQRGHPFTVDSKTGMTVLYALSARDLDDLTDLTAQLRRPVRAQSSGKAVSFYEKTIVHEAPPSSPSPPPNVHSLSSLLSSSPPSVRLIPGAAPGFRGSAYYHVPPKFEPLHPPGPSTPRPAEKAMAPLITSAGKTPEQRIEKAKEKAARAESIAIKKERRAIQTQREADEEDAWRARIKAEERKRKAYETERKQTSKLERRRKSDGKVLIGRNSRGEVVVVKG